MSNNTDKSAPEKIPVARPSFGAEEELAVLEVFRSGWVVQGPRVQELERGFCESVGSACALAVSNGTSALHLALSGVGVAPGDIVITVSFSFIATANAVRHCGAEPVFIDIERDTYNMDPRLLARFLAESCRKGDNGWFVKDVTSLITPCSPLRYIDKSRVGRVAAVMPVHQMGMPCDMGGILSVCQSYGLPVVEDAACAIGARIRLHDGDWEPVGKPHGVAACFSFHPRKVLTTGEGGMITCNDPELYRRMKLLREHGMSLTPDVRHVSGQAESYEVTAYNYRMTDIQAAIGSVQLSKVPDFVAERRRLAEQYREQFREIRWIEFPEEPPYACCNRQSFPVRVLSGAPLTRDKVMGHLQEQGIATRRGIPCIHKEPPYIDSGWCLPESEAASRESLILPLYNGMTPEQTERVGKTMAKIG